MELLDSMKAFFVRRMLLSRKVPKDCENPLEGWMAIKAREVLKKSGSKFPASERTDTIGREEFEEYQLLRFREQMKYAEAEAPHYRSLYKDAGIRPEDIRTYEDLEKVPFTYSHDLAEKPYSFCAVSVTKLAREFTTTGTTGRRKTIGFTSGDLVGKVDIIASALSNIGMRKGDSLHIMFPTVSAWDPSLMMSAACKVLGYGSSTCSDTDIAMQMKVMREAGSTHIIGLPSFIYRVTALMGKETDLKTLGIKKIISTSEPLSESVRKTLEEAWGCKVLDVWGMTEMGLACAVECDEQDGLHTDEANILFEVIDPETGKHVPAGQEGELVVSGLNSQGTVLLRYRTNDLVSMQDPPCDCGMSFNKKLNKPHGRVDMQSKVGMGYKVYPLLFDEVLFKENDVVEYQLKITKENYRDVLTFEVETPAPSHELEERIISLVSSVREVSDGIAEDLIERPRVRFVDVGLMEYSAKAKKIVDLRENYD